MKRHIELRSSLESLESRIAPANITAAVVNHVLRIVGTDDANSLTIDGVAGDATAFKLTTGGDTINGSSGPFTTISGVTGIAIKMLGGDDSVIFSSDVVSIDVKGSVTINGGAGANSVIGTDLTVEKNLSITSGAHSTGIAVAVLINSSVNGSVTIKNGSGDTLTEFYRTSAGLSTIGGNLSITNGAGKDRNAIVDVNIGHNLTVKNGHASATGDPGYTEIFNSINTNSRSVIGGNVSISYLDGDGSGTPSDGISDTAVLGNVTIDHGKGNFTTNFDAYGTSLPVIIRGNLTLKGSGANTITAGTEYQRSGLIVGKNLSITSGSGTDTLTLNKLEVAGGTQIRLGNGGSTITIDDSIFAGAFKLTTGAGDDTLNLDTTPGSPSPTIFEKPVLIQLGVGDDVLNETGAADANQFLIIDSTFVVHHGSGSDTRTSTASHELFPFHNSIQWVK
jgi:hypothetical protein